MPAIRKEYLNQQIEGINNAFLDPDQFTQRIIDLCEYYSNRVKKYGQTGKPKPIIDQYGIPKPVLRQLIQAITGLATNSSAQTLILIDKLWNKRNLEFQLIASHMIGTLSFDYEDQVIQKISTWIDDQLDIQIELTISDASLGNIRTYAPRKLLSYIENWLGKENKKQKHLAFLALIPIINNPNHDYLPEIFSMIKPYIRNIPEITKPDLLHVIQTLAERSPIETAYFLKHNLHLYNKHDTAWLIRQSINHFPNNIKIDLRSELRLAKSLER